MNPTIHESSSQSRLNRTLWFGLLAGPVAWVLELPSVYALAEWACHSENLILLHLTVFACLLLAVSGGVVAWRSWQPMLGWPAETDEGATARVRLLSALGVMTSGLFTLVLITHWLAVALLWPCPW